MGTDKHHFSVGDDCPACGDGTLIRNCTQVTWHLVCSECRRVPTKNDKRQGETIIKY